MEITTKQEKIRENLAKWLFTFVKDRENIYTDADWEIRRDYYMYEAADLLKILQSQGVVILIATMPECLGAEIESVIEPLIEVE